MLDDDRARSFPEERLVAQAVGGIRLGELAGALVHAFTIARESGVAVLFTLAVVPAAGGWISTRHGVVGAGALGLAHLLAIKELSGRARRAVSAHAFLLPQRPVLGAMHAGKRRHTDARPERQRAVWSRVLVPASRLARVTPPPSAGESIR